MLSIVALHFTCERKKIAERRRVVFVFVRVGAHAFAFAHRSPIKRPRTSQSAFSCSAAPSARSHSIHSRLIHTATEPHTYTLTHQHHCTHTTLAHIAARPRQSFAPRVFLPPSHADETHARRSTVRRSRGVATPVPAFGALQQLVVSCRRCELSVRELSPCVPFRPFATRVPTAFSAVFRLHFVKCVYPIVSFQSSVVVLRNQYICLAYYLALFAV